MAKDQNLDESKRQATSNRDIDSGNKIDKDLISGTDAQQVSQGASRVNEAYDQNLTPGQPGYDADRDVSAGGTNKNR